MAWTKGRLAITQVTATGQSTTLDVADAVGVALHVRHVNGTGTITAGATAIVQCRPDGGTIWFNLTTFTFGTVASATETRVVDVPDGAGDVRLDYTAPTGSTGHTLDAEAGTVTGTA